MYSLIWSSSFTSSAERFVKNHPELRKKFAAVLRELEVDPFQPHLKYHRLGGSLKGVQAVSITYSYRITLTILVSDKEIILLDVGSHDEVYRS
jgi:mRNA-degrading endonuclease YafQ of YafQ-DinJ toxin-antitoxin module